MNERIRELYEQAHERKPVMVIDPQTGNPIQAGWANKPMYGNEFNPEKFAELIVRECAIIANQHMEHNEGTDYNVGGKIKQHFGVKS